MKGQEIRKVLLAKMPWLLARIADYVRLKPLASLDQFPRECRLCVDADGATMEVTATKVKWGGAGCVVSYDVVMCAGEQATTWADDLYLIFDDPTAVCCACGRDHWMPRRGDGWRHEREGNWLLCYCPECWPCRRKETE